MYKTDGFIDSDVVRGVVLPGIGRVPVDCATGDLATDAPRVAMLLGIEHGAATTAELDAQRRRQRLARDLARHVAEV